MNQQKNEWFVEVDHKFGDTCTIQCARLETCIKSIQKVALLLVDIVGVLRCDMFFCSFDSRVVSG